MFSSLLDNPIAFLLYITGLIVAITIHEFSHALIADRLGDPTPRLQGRLTLNPLAHLDPIGTIFLFIFRFGWGKPVVFDPFNLENPRRDAAVISLAGPASNLILATILSLLVRLSPAVSPSIASFSGFLIPVIYVNVMLAIFNLVPVHPLDGGKILVGFLPHDLAIEAQDILHRYGMIILIALIFPLFHGTSAVSYLISPVINFILNLLLST